jgi:GNAT superfamily N-acetyltransferase
VYLWLADDERIIGYYAVVPHSIRREDAPSSVGRGAPDMIPGFLLARLALSEELHGQHLGGDLLAEALTTILDAIRLAGGRVIVVDAIDDRARGFYEHFGFRSLPLNDDRLVMKASTAAASLSIDWP